jgi:hypothetical protein
MGRRAGAGKLWVRATGREQRRGIWVGCGAGGEPAAAEWAAGPELATWSRGASCRSRTAAWDMGRKRPVAVGGITGERDWRRRGWGSAGGGLDRRRVAA